MTTIDDGWWSVCTLALNIYKVNSSFGWNQSINSLLLLLSQASIIRREADICTHHALKVLSFTQGLERINAPTPTSAPRWGRSDDTAEGQSVTIVITSCMGLCTGLPPYFLSCHILSWHDKYLKYLDLVLLIVCDSRNVRSLRATSNTASPATTTWKSAVRPSSQRGRTAAHRSQRRRRRRSRGDGQLLQLLRAVVTVTGDACRERQQGRARPRFRARSKALSLLMTAFDTRRRSLSAHSLKVCCAVLWCAVLCYTVLCCAV